MEIFVGLLPFITLKEAVSIVTCFMRFIKEERTLKRAISKGMIALQDPSMEIQVHIIYLMISTTSFVRPKRPS